MWSVKKFTQEDFSNETNKIKRLYMYLVQPNDFRLKNGEQQYLDMLSKTYALLSKVNTDKEKKNIILHLHDGMYRSEVETIFRDTQELYGYFKDTLSKDIIKMLYLRKKLEIADKMQAILDDDENSVENRIAAASLIEKVFESLSKKFKVEENELNELQTPNIVYEEYDPKKLKSETEDE